MQGSLTGRITSRIAILAAFALGLAAPALAATAGPAQAITVVSICNPFPTCMNFWGGGYNVRTYDGIGVANDNMQLQSIGGGQYQIADRLHGGCVGDGYNDPNVEWAQGGHTCPSTGYGSWGTIFTLDYLSCASYGQGWFKLRNNHSGKDLGFATGNNFPVWLNILPGSATCVAQFG